MHLSHSPSKPLRRKSVNRLLHIYIYISYVYIYTYTRIRRDSREHSLRFPRTRAAPSIRHASRPRLSSLSLSLSLSLSFSLSLSLSLSFSTFRRSTFSFSSQTPSPQVEAPRARALLHAKYARATCESRNNTQINTRIIIQLHKETRSLHIHTDGYKYKTRVHLSINERHRNARGCLRTTNVVQCLPLIVASPL